MKELVVLGAGTAGTIVANRLSTKLPPGWRVSVVDPEHDHLYQPGLIFLPFGARDEARNVRARRKTLAKGVRWLRDGVSRVDPAEKTVRLASGDRLGFDLLVIATGSQIRPDETPGLEGCGWRRDVHEFYTLPGALALRKTLSSFRGGRLLVNVVEMPIKCPVAPLEFLFLADAFFTRRGMRDDVEIVFATPLDGAFTKPTASRIFGSLLDNRGVAVETEFMASEVDPAARVLKSYDERELGYDLLVSVPVHTGARFVEDSGLGNELGFIPTEPGTLRAKNHDGIFVLGDATDLPTSKAGSVAHFQSEIVVENVLRTVRGEALEDAFDGHANCFIETGYGRGIMIDFNYDVEPLPGQFPLPVFGPFSLLKTTRVNHWGKLGFRWLYWNAMLPGRTIPIPNQMSMAGKRRLAAVPA